MNVLRTSAPGDRVVSIDSVEQQDAEAEVEGFRRDLGPFVVATEKTRMPMAFTDAKEPSNSIIFANDSFLSLTGYKRRDVLGRPFNSLMTGFVDLATMAKVDSAFAGTCNSDAEIHYRRKDGSEFWASLFVSPVRDENGDIAQYFLSLIDLTESKRSEFALRQAVERFEMVSKATADIVWDWHLAQDTIWWSDGMLALFGYDIIGLQSGSSSWTDHIHPSDRERVLKGVQAAIDGVQGQWSAEYRFLRKDGSCAQVIHRGFVVRDDTGKSVRMVGSLADVTKQRTLESQLRQAQRIDAVGQLTGGVAHDFNNLLTVILSNAEILEEKFAEDAKTLASAEMIRIAAERGAELTQRLLAFSRRQTLDPKSIDVNALISGMEPLFRRALGDHIETEIKVQDGLWPALIDAPQLESAMLNLCINARDAMTEGGKITIEVVNVQLDASNIDEHVSAEPGQYVLIAVSDAGTGMNEETLARAFEPFFTTKEVGKGSGLGLSMVHGFVEQSRGRLKIQSAVGKGTCVKLYLPRALKDAERFEAPLTSGVLQGGFEKVLIVEDNDLVRAQVTSELRTLGYRVVSVEQGSQALEAIRQTPDFDLLFTDSVLPGGMDGRQLAEEARKLRPTLPVLFTSGHTENGAEGHGQLNPGVPLLKKPYRRRELAAKIREVLSSNEKTASEQQLKSSCQ